MIPLRDFEGLASNDGLAKTEPDPKGPKLDPEIRQTRKGGDECLQDRGKREGDLNHAKMSHMLARAIAAIETILIRS